MPTSLCLEECPLSYRNPRFSVLIPLKFLNENPNLKCDGIGLPGVSDVNDVMGTMESIASKDYEWLDHFLCPLYYGKTHQECDSLQTRRVSLLDLCI